MSMVRLEKCEKVDLAGKELHIWKSCEVKCLYKIRREQILDLLENQTVIFFNSY